MKDSNIARSYVNLETAGALLGVSAIDLIHAGAFNQVQICVNIYARAAGLSMVRIDVEIDGDDFTDMDAETREKAHANDKIFFDWIDRLKINVMPAGIYEVTQDDLRLFEMPENESIELGEAYKSDDRGLWEIEFDPLVNAARSDLVMLTTEIERIKKNGGIGTSPIDKPMTTRERTSYLNIIGALLAQLTAGKANDTTVITQAVADFGAQQGISKRKLEQTFASAKRSLNSG
jgi:hypothetical protein